MSLFVVDFEYLILNWMWDVVVNKGLPLVKSGAHSFIWKDQIKVCRRHCWHLQFSLYR